MGHFTLNRVKQFQPLAYENKIKSQLLVSARGFGETNFRPLLDSDNSHHQKYSKSTDYVK
jgi:hypothetical protein